MRKLRNLDPRGGHIASLARGSFGAVAGHEPGGRLTSARVGTDLQRVESAETDPANKTHETVELVRAFVAISKPELRAGLVSLQEAAVRHGLGLIKQSSCWPFDSEQQAPSDQDRTSSPSPNGRPSSWPTIGKS